MGEDTRIYPYKKYSSLNCGKLTKFYFLHLLSIIYYSVTTNLRSGKKVSYLSLGDVNLRDGLGTPFNKPRLYVLNSRLHGVL
jgi:hypothetical protein